MDEHVWQRIVEGIDDDGSGEINFEEFCKMMQQMMSDEKEPEYKKEEKSKELDDSEEGEDE